MNKKVTRIVAAAIALVLAVIMLLSLIVPYL